jgi:hypothetical protein
MTWLATRSTSPGRRACLAFGLDGMQPTHLPASGQEVSDSDGPERRQSVPVHTVRSRRHRTIIAVSVAIGVVLVISYLIWCAWLRLLATEGDVPSVSSLAFPEGASVTKDESCGSGGCWSTFTARPGKDSSTTELTSYLETTYGGHVLGSFWDPRTINLSTEIAGNTVVVTASCWITYD